MTKQEIIDYIMTTPSNPNKAVLEGMLDSIADAGGGGSFTLVGTDMSTNQIKTIKIPNGVTSIGAETFNGYRALESIAIPDSVTSIGDSAFGSCVSLVSVIIPSGVTSINSLTFDACFALANVAIPDSVTDIGASAFKNCKSLTSVIIPSGVTSIAAQAFSQCTALKSITVRATTPPTIQSNTFNNVPTDAIIYVPSESVDAYKSATNWSARASYIQAISE